jgi:hypothetical protein
MINFVKTDIYGLTNCIQLQRSGLFLADRQEQVLSHSVVACTNNRFNDFFD